MLEEVSAQDNRSKREKLDGEARGQQAPDRPMEFTIRADPGVSGGLAGSAGKLGYNKGKLTAETAGGGEFSANAPDNPNLTVITIPMRPFSPFNDSPAKVEKRSGGPYAATFEEKGSDYSINWSAKQMGGKNARRPSSRQKWSGNSNNCERCWRPSTRCDSLCS